MDENIIFKNFENKTKKKDNKKLKIFLGEIKKFVLPEFLKSFKKDYKYSYKKEFLNSYKKFKNINIIGMGGASLGSKAIYSFLQNKIKKNIYFFENLKIKKKKK